MGKPKPKKVKEPLETRQLKRLLVKLNAKETPVNVPVTVEKYSKNLQCYTNVAKKIAESGGSPCYGWHIHRGKFIYEGEHHTVWKNDEGELIDVTPNEDKKEQILFLIDNDSYEGSDIPNVRINITDNVFVDDFIEICETLDVLYTFSVRKSEEQIVMPVAITKFIAYYSDLKNMYWKHLYNDTYLTSDCICGNKLKYGKCHRPIVKKEIIENLETARKIYNKDNS